MAARSGGHLERGAQAAGPEGHGVGEEALDQVVGGVLEGGPVAVGKAAEAEPDASGGFLDGQGQGAVGHGCGAPRGRTRSRAATGPGRAHDGYCLAMATRRRSSGLMRWSWSSTSKSIWTHRTRPLKRLSFGP